MGVLSVLTIVFAIAKILGFVAWSWWLVFLPMIVDVVITIVVFIIAWNSV